MSNVEPEWRSGVDSWPLHRSALVHPHPVAVASGRVLAADTHAAAVDAILKAGEVITRYVAGLAVASWAARESSDDTAVSAPSGNLSFGHFLSLAQQLAKREGHPLGPSMAALRASKAGPGKADAALTALLNLRNDVGHDLSSMSRAKAETVLTQRLPLDHLLATLLTLDGMLSLPLFVAEVSGYRESKYRISRTLLMGDSANRAADIIESGDPVDVPNVPYVSAGGLLLPLPPFIGWRHIAERENFELTLLDAIEEHDLRHATIYANERRDAGAAPILRELLAGGRRRTAKGFRLLNGKSLDETWHTVRRGLEGLGRALRREIPWARYSDKSVRWLAQRIGGGPGDPRSAIQERLFDGRSDLTDDESFQLDILLGRVEVVAEAIRRPIVDLKESGGTDARLDSRLESTGNLVDVLQVAVPWVVERIDRAHAAADSLASSTGSPDYLAIREALVNLFVHQDYRLAFPAQVELRPGKTVVFNPGSSMVAADRLIDGGRSIPRNPVLARALKLIGWAESAGSGIRAVRTTWERAGRRPPTFASNEGENSFTVELTWDPKGADYSVEWHRRLGVELTANQATVLEFIVDAGEPTPKAIIASCGLTSSDAEAALEHLVRQGLVMERQYRYRTTPFVKAALRKIRRS